MQKRGGGGVGGGEAGPGVAGACPHSSQQVPRQANEWAAEAVPPPNRQVLICLYSPPSRC